MAESIKLVVRSRRLGRRRNLAHSALKTYVADNKAEKRCIIVFNKESLSRLSV